MTVFVLYNMRNPILLVELSDVLGLGLWPENHPKKQTLFRNRKDHYDK